ncbi:MAG TPA: 2Fe-2S iron-sulfur cluster-binding protein [Burkholderiales bacterium]|nr:2Fe-2S iron-sulfur cluster-binding protein [Burkholderiales bacterium]
MKFVITIEDPGRQLTVEQDEILLTALLSRGVRFAYSCQSGECGACKCRLVSGKVRTLAHSDTALSGRESEEGTILACRSLVHGDLTIRLLTAPGA